MEFTLFYKGIIKSGNHNSVENKNDIRQKIHEQLVTLRNYPPLNIRADLFKKSEFPDFHKTVNKYDFFFLVSDKWNMYVELDLKILIPHDYKGFGDIDNKLKTLFDALRPPKDSSELPSSWTPTSTQNPMLCLLEDDDLIFKVNIDTDYLLDTTLTENGEIIIIINVKVKGNSGQIGILDLII
ncbi:MAG: hypothetical protein ABI199_00800 [Bacteroidia bacterium]